MAQGTIKAKPSKTAPKKTAGASHHDGKGVTKRGSLQMNPRKAKLQKQAKMSKKLTSGLTAKTERMLGEKAGHMELIGKGRSKGGPNTGSKAGGKDKGVAKKK